MKICDSSLKFVILLFISFHVWNCVETPLNHDLSHSELELDTLVINDISVANYRVAPSLGSNERLYVGNKNGIDVPLSLIKIGSGYWNYSFDSTITIDSLRFILYSKDSSLLENSTPKLFFSPDSQFNENSSTYLDFIDFSLSDWSYLDQANLKVNTDTTDT